ncbi:MAG: YbaK/EbsC family protein [Rhodococcus sp. (in: high G+C Gram-positive bacteria)]|nr:MAG: YbaK/EbsC family protein [Rhodococcus sp. (in: high G+C Gram-positive bacteria)]
MSRFRTDAAASVSTALIDAGLTDRMRIFDTPVPTATEATRTLGCETAAIVNSLGFNGDGSPLLILASGAHRVDTERLAGELGFDSITRASKKFVVEAAGQQVGGVSPIGHPQPLRTILDSDLEQQQWLWAGGGDPYTMFRASYTELLAITTATPMPVA